MSKKSPITCHVLDSSTGKPAEGVAIALQRHRKISDQGDVFSFDPIAHGKTNEDGRCLDLLAPTRDSVEDLAILHPGFYKIVFHTKEYFESTNRQCFYPWVEESCLSYSAIQYWLIPTHYR